MRCGCQIVSFLLASSLAMKADAQVPPFSGTGFIDGDIITMDDPSAFQSLEYLGQRQRQVFDRRPAAWVNIQMMLFRASFSDCLSSEIHVNP